MNSPHDRFPAAPGNSAGPGRLMSATRRPTTLRLRTSVPTPGRRTTFRVGTSAPTPGWVPSGRIESVRCYNNPINLGTIMSNSAFGDVIGGSRLAGRSPGRRSTHALPKAPITYRIRSAADVAERPVTPAEAAQARLFEGILQREIVQLLSLVRPVAPRWAEKSAHEHRPPAARTEVDARIDEVDRLLKALRDRFPRDPSVGGPLESRHPIQDRRRHHSGNRQIVFPTTAGRRTVP